VQKLKKKVWRQRVNVYGNEKGKRRILTDKEIYAILNKPTDK
jgi:hypothetical protein